MTIFLTILKSVILCAVDEEFLERDVNLAFVDAIAADDAAAKANDFYESAKLYYDALEQGSKKFM